MLKKEKLPDSQTEPQELQELQELMDKFNVSGKSEYLYCDDADTEGPGSSSDEQVEQGNESNTGTPAADGTLNNEPLYDNPDSFVDRYEDMSGANGPPVNENRSAEYELSEGVQDVSNQGFIRIDNGTNELQHNRAVANETYFNNFRSDNGVNKNIQSNPQIPSGFDGIEELPQLKYDKKQDWTENLKRILFPEHLYKELNNTNTKYVDDGRAFIISKLQEILNEISAEEKNKFEIFLQKKLPNKVNSLKDSKGGMRLIGILNGILKSEKDSNTNKIKEFQKELEKSYNTGDVVANETYDNTTFDSSTDVNSKYYDGTPTSDSNSGDYAEAQSPAHDDAQQPVYAKPFPRQLSQNGSPSNNRGLSFVREEDGYAHLMPTNRNTNLINAEQDPQYQPQNLKYSRLSANGQTYENFDPISGTIKYNDNVDPNYDLAIDGDGTNQHYENMSNANPTDGQPTIYVGQNSNNSSIKPPLIYPDE
jgi:hypothetical protein